MPSATALFTHLDSYPTAHLRVRLAELEKLQQDPVTRKVALMERAVVMRILRRRPGFNRVSTPSKETTIDSL